MKRILGIVFRLLATGTITLLIAACYGVMMQFKRITVRSPEDSAIGGLKVTVSDGDIFQESTLTDSSGRAEFTSGHPLEGAQAVIEDIDGPANDGDFATKEFVLDAESEYFVTMTRK